MAAAKVAEATIKAAFDVIADTIAAGITDRGGHDQGCPLGCSKALYAMYRAFRDVLMLRVLRVAVQRPARSELWRPCDHNSLAVTREHCLVPARGDPGGGEADREQLRADRCAQRARRNARTLVHRARMDQPRPRGHGCSRTPDAFIDAALGTNMFAKGGPQKATTVGGVKSFGAAEKELRRCGREHEARDRSRDGHGGGDVPELQPRWRPHLRLAVLGCRAAADDERPPPGDPLDPGDPANQPSMIATVNAVPLP